MFEKLFSGSGRPGAQQPTTGGDAQKNALRQQMIQMMMQGGGGGGAAGTNIGTGVGALAGAMGSALKNRMQRQPGQAQGPAPAVNPNLPGAPAQLNPNGPQPFPSAPQGGKPNPFAGLMNFMTGNRTGGMY